MGITVDWDNSEHTIARIEVPETWSWTEVKGVHAQFAAMAQTSPGVVYLIIDISKARKLPDNALSALRRYTGDYPKNTGLIIFVGASSVVQALLKLSQKLSQKSADKYVFAATDEQAYALIAEHERANLASVPIN